MVVLEKDDCNNGNIKGGKDDKFSLASPLIII
jgi:hypothetical protein